MNRKTVALVAGAIVVIGVGVGTWWCLSHRGVAPETVALPKVNEPKVLEAYAADQGAALVNLASVSTSPPTSGGEGGCQKWAAEKVDPLGSPKALFAIVDGVPDANARAGAGALVASLRDFLGSCGTAQQKTMADELIFQAVVNQRLMGVGE